MAKYRLKCNDIEAFIWTGGADQTEDPEWLVEAIKNELVRIINNPLEMVISTLYGPVTAEPGDYVFQDLYGRIQAMQPNEFESYYEEVKDPDFSAPYSSEIYKELNP